jgi:hypothetical protein
VRCGIEPFAYSILEVSDLGTIHDPNNGPTRGNADGFQTCVEASLADSIRETQWGLIGNSLPGNL